MKKVELHWQILLAMVLGIIFGITFQQINNNPVLEALHSLIVSFGTIFIRLLKRFHFI